MNQLFRENSLSFDIKEAVINLNGVKIEAYAIHHLDE
jgi:hypothetical protein